MSKAYRPIPVVEHPTRKRFRRAFQRQEPSILRGLASSEHLASWSLAALAEALGHVAVLVIECHQGNVFRVASPSTYAMRERPFAELVSKLLGPDDSAPPEYLQAPIIGSQPGFTSLPQLRSRLMIPAILDAERIVIAKLFLGTGGHRTPCHFDGVHNILTQVQGRKDVILFSPRDSMYLYQTTTASGFFASPVDPRRRDYDAFPLLRRARGYRGVLEPGDSIFIPALWWHDVLSLGVNVAINYWVGRARNMSSCAGSSASWAR